MQVLAARTFFLAKFNSVSSLEMLFLKLSRNLSKTCEQLITNFASHISFEEI